MMTIQGAMPPMGMVAQGSGSLTEAQQESLEAVLSTYDTEKLSDDDAKSLVDQITELEIQPGRALTEALSNAGIDAGSLAEQSGLAVPTGQKDPEGGPGGPGGGGPGGAQGSKGPDSAEAQTMQSIVEQLQELSEESETDEDFTALLLEKLEEAGLDTSQPIIDFSV